MGDFGTLCKPSFGRFHSCNLGKASGRKQLQKLDQPRDSAAVTFPSPARMEVTIPTSNRLISGLHHPQRWPGCQEFINPNFTTTSSEKLTRIFKNAPNAPKKHRMKIRSRVQGPPPKTTSPKFNKTRWKPRTRMFTRYFEIERS